MFKNLSVNSKVDVEDVNQNNSNANETIEEVKFVLELPEASIKNLLVDPQEREHYTIISNRLGFQPPELVVATLLEYFQTNGIALYDFDKVYEYLTFPNGLPQGIRTKPTKWYWRPLREEDRVDYFLGIREEYQEEGESSISWVRVGCYNPILVIDSFSFTRGDETVNYDCIVPLRVLKKVDSISKLFGDIVAFFVSDYYSPNPPNPDPFIAVVPRNEPPCPQKDFILIFDMWDEPGFIG